MKNTDNHNEATFIKHSSQLDGYLTQTESLRFPESFWVSYREMSCEVMLSLGWGPGSDEPKPLGKLGSREAVSQQRKQVSERSERME